MALRAGDLRATAELVGSLGEAESFDEFCARLLPGLLELVPGDLATYDEPDLRARRNLIVTWPEATKPTTNATFAQHMHEHPVIRHFVKTGDRDAYAISDFWSARRLRATRLWAEVLGPRQREDDLAVLLAPRDGVPTGMSVQRDRRSFSRRDREVLAFVAPFVSRAREAALVRDEHARLRAALAQGLESTGAALVVLDRRGRVVYGTSAGLRRLREHGWRRDAVPDELLALRDGDLIVFDAPAPTRRQLEALGLTRTEAMILDRIATRNATNAELAAELVVSVRTIEKHLEHVYAKLGVRDRRAAVESARRRAPDV